MKRQFGGRFRGGMKESTEPGAWKGLAIAGAVLAVVMVRYFYPSASGSSSPSFLAGYNLPMALGVYYLIRWIFGKYSQAGIEFACFVVILAAFVGSDYIGHREKKTNTLIAKSEVAAAYKQMVDSTTDKDGMPVVSGLNIDTTATSVGDEGQLETFTKSYMNKLLRVQDAYLKGLGEIGWERILDPARVARPDSYPESVAIILQAKALLVKYESDFRAMRDQAPSDVEAMTISDVSKREAISSFNVGVIATEPKVKEVFDNELEVLIEIENAVEFLENSRDRWKYEDGKFAFYEEADLEKYNIMYANIQRLVQLQEEQAKVNQKLALDMLEGSD